MKVSVIIPTYNGAKVIRECLRSVNSQEGNFDLEILVCDDCSTDDTLGIVMSCSDARILKNSEHTGGPNAGRNKGIDRATGDVICFLDQDDIWYADKLIRQLKIVEQVTTGTIVFTGVEYLNKNYHHCSDKRVEYLPKNETFKHILACRWKHCMDMSSIMIPGGHGPYFEEEYGMVDFDWVLRLTHNMPTVRIKESLVAKRFPNGLSREHHYRLCTYAKSLSTIEVYADEYPREAARGRRKVVGTMARHYYRRGDYKNAQSFFGLSGLIWGANSLYWLASIWRQAWE